MTNTLVLSYLAVRKSIGVIGLALPCLLLLGTLAPPVFMQKSISLFYYTPMRDIFVGILFALGVFLIAYKGYEPNSPKLITDKSVSTIAGISAIGVAMFPTPSPYHFISAGLFFAMTALFCLVLFTKTDGDLTPAKRQRNLIYKICGWTIVAMIALLTYIFLADPVLPWKNTIFWAESICIWAFGLSWLIKGEGFGMLNDG